MIKLKKKYYIWTIGCQMNKSDSERVAAILESINYQPVQKESEADLIVIVSCSVRQSAEDRVYGKARGYKKLKIETCLPAGRNLKLSAKGGCASPAPLRSPRKLVEAGEAGRAGAKIVLSGCMANRKDVRKKLAGVVDIFLDINDLTNLPELLGEKKSLDQDYLKMLPKLQSSFQAYVPIMTGCNNFCAYCVVPYARGREKSRSINDVLCEVKELVKRGYKEVTLLGQNVNSYKFERGRTRSREVGRADFVRLLERINQIPGDFWIRFVSLHPKDMSDDLIKAMGRLDKVCEYVHLPFQAGDNMVLKNMNRKYTRAHYLKLIEKIRKHVPGAAISTDVIVGFPGETTEQFKKSVEVFKKAKFDMAYIARYSPRPGTAAEKMKDKVNREEKKRREKELNKILIKTALANNKKYISRVMPVLVESEKREKNKSYYLGKNRTFKNVKFFGPSGLLGSFQHVKIVDAETWGIKGELFSNN